MDDHNWIRLNYKKDFLLETTNYYKCTICSLVKYVDYNEFTKEENVWFFNDTFKFIEYDYNYISCNEYLIKQIIE